MPDLSLWHWLVLLISGLVVGLSKTGVPGLGILPVIVFALVLGDVRRSAAVLLPLLCVADVISLWLWRRHADSRKLLDLAPWVVGGMVVAVVALRLPSQDLGRLVGLVILLMAGLQLRRRLRGELTAPAGSFSTAAHGLLAGLATTLANAAGPVMNLYLLGRRLPKEEFLATGAWFFFLINLAKLPLYAAMPLLGSPAMFDRSGLLLTAALVPPVVLGALLGGAIGKRIPQRWFEWTVLILALVGGVGILLGGPGAVVKP